MLNRRDFFLKHAPAATLGLAAALQGRSLSGSEEGVVMSGAYYECSFLRLQSGQQVSRILRWLEKRALPLYQKHGLGAASVFTMEVGPYLPAVFLLVTSPSLAAMEAAWAKIDADPAWTAALAELEAEAPAFYREDTLLLRATPFSPPLKATAPGDPAHKIFELRIYESPTFQQLGYLHDRFAGGEIEVFHRNGIHPVLYADTIIGPNKPNMAYLIPFESEAHREKAWAAFRNDPEWIRLRDESIRRGGEIVRNITNMLLVPTSFSMIR